MPSDLPAWLDYYLHVPVWVLFSSFPEHRILWVNERVAEDNRRDREWFVGRAGAEVWPESSGGGHLDAQAMAEGRAVDTIVDGRDLSGVMRWFDVRRTPIGTDRILHVLEDVTASIKLAGLRLVLGRGLAGESRTKLNESFARQLLEDTSLEDLSKGQGMKPADVLAKLTLVVSEHVHPATEGPLRPSVDDALPTEGLPDWVQHYRDLPLPVGLLDYPSLHVRWVNRIILERNKVQLEDVIGRHVEELVSEGPEWRPFCERAMAERGPIDTIQVGRNLSGEQRWVFLHLTPVGSDCILAMIEDVTAQLRLGALRLLLGLSPSGHDEVLDLDESFARLLLDGASVANLCAALEMSQSEVLGKLGLVLGQLG